MTVENNTDFSLTPYKWAKIGMKKGIVKEK